jgi:Transposase DDE domain
LRQPERDQPGWQILALDDLVAPDHSVRAVWAFVQTLDVQPLHEAVKALDRMKELEAERNRRTQTNKAQVEKQKEPRASTTDPQARSMKMADGGFRPAYNLQIVCEPQSQVVVAVDVDSTGSDHGMARRGLEQLAAGDLRPADYLVDGGFAKHEDIEWAHQAHIRLWCPAMKNKHGTDP